MRALLQLVGANFYNPICQFFFQATNPVLMPLRRILPRRGRLDVASCLVAYLVQVLKVLLLIALFGAGAGIAGVLLLALAELVSLLLNLYLILILVRIVLSFVGVDRGHPALPLLVQLSEPVLGPVRRALPATGAIDFSPMLVLLAILLARVLVVAPLADFGRRLL